MSLTCCSISSFVLNAISGELNRLIFWICVLNPFFFLSFFPPPTPTHFQISRRRRRASRRASSRRRGGSCWRRRQKTRENPVETSTETGQGEEAERWAQFFVFSHSFRWFIIESHNRKCDLSSKIKRKKGFALILWFIKTVIIFSIRWKRSSILWLYVFVF